MKYFVFIFAALAGSNVLAQSKKQLAAQVDQLKTENAGLQSQIEELKKPKVVELKDTISMVSYSIGTFVAGNLKSQGGDSLQMDALAAGLKDTFEGVTPRIDQAQGMTIVQTYMQKAMALKSAKSKAANAEFLEKNKTAEGVKTTASGLQYKIITSGKGKSPSEKDKVTVHYTGKLVDGFVFDSSVERNQPLTIDVGGVIPGWTEVLQLMKEGDKWTVFIPYQLAYGEQGAGEQIPPYSTLIFDIELLKVN